MKNLDQRNQIIEYSLKLNSTNLSPLRSGNISLRGKEGDKDVDGNNNVDKELSKWVRVISPSAHDEKTQVFQTMEDDEKPEFGLLVVPVDLPAGEEGEGEPEGGDEVHQPLPHHALAKLG